MSTKEQLERLRQMPHDIKAYSDILATLEKLLQQENAMSQKERLSYAKKIKPLMRGTSGYVELGPQTKAQELYWIPAYPISTQSFAFSCHCPLKPAKGLKEIGRITTYHRYGGFYGLLRPSTDEAIIQCPKEILDKVCAFEFQTDTLEFRKVYHAGLDRHILTTVYYEGSLPEDIAAQDVRW